MEIYIIMKNGLIYNTHTNIYTKEFLIKLIKQEISKSERYATNVMLIYFDYKFLEEDFLQRLSCFFDKEFRIEDTLAYSREDNRFYFLFFMFQIEDLQVIRKKIFKIFHNHIDIKILRINKNTDIKKIESI